MPDSIPSADAPSQPAGPLVAILAYDGLCTFEFGLAVEVFGLARPEFGADWYRFRVVGERPGPMRAAGGITVDVDCGLAGLDEADIVMIPGWRGIEAPVPDAVTDAIRRAHDRGARILTICSGVVVPAAAGLLDGGRATTHWRYVEAVAARFPAVRVEPDVLYLEQGRVWTSAGSAAGFDLCLHLIRQDYGAAVANSVARRLVVPPHRDGGQAQFIDRPVPARPDTRFQRLFDWLRAHLDQPISVDRMAGEAAMSKRSFIRHFKATTGLAPSDWMARERVGRAKDLLETTDLSIEAVAAAAGFGSPETLRTQFRRQLRVSPSAYRERFSRPLRTEAVAGSGYALPLSSTPLPSGSRR